MVYRKYDYTAKKYDSVRDQFDIKTRAQTGNFNELYTNKKTKKSTQDGKVFISWLENALKKQKAKKESNSKTKTNNNTGSSESEEGKKFETGTGIAFGGQMSAQIIHDVMYKFILGDLNVNQSNGNIDLMYHYNIGGVDLGVRDMIQVAIPDNASEWLGNKDNKYNIYNIDESMILDPFQFMSYSGSLASYIRDLSNAPFNEIFWTHEENSSWSDAIDKMQVDAIKNKSGNTLPNPYRDDLSSKVRNTDIYVPKATMHYRQTPFEPTQWFNLKKIKVKPEEVISISLDYTDAEQYSVFSLTGTQETMQDVSLMPPVTDDQHELERRYGYKYMDVQSDYFTNTHQNVDLDSKTKAKISSAQDEDELNGVAGIGYPSFQTFNMYFMVDSAKFKSHDLDNMPISPIDGGDELYEEVLKILDKYSKGYNEKAVATQKQIDKLNEAFKGEKDSAKKKIYKAQLKALNTQLGKYTQNNSLQEQSDIVNLPQNKATYVDTNGKEHTLKGKKIITLETANTLIRTYNHIVNDS